MKKSKLTGEQIAFALRQAEVGTPVAELCQKMGITPADEGPDLSFWPDTKPGQGQRCLMNRYPAI